MAKETLRLGLPIFYTGKQPLTLNYFRGLHLLNPEWFPKRSFKNCPPLVTVRKKRLLWNQVYVPQVIISHIFFHFLIIYTDLLNKELRNLLLKKDFFLNRTGEENYTEIRSEQKSYFFWDSEELQ